MSKTLHHLSLRILSPVIGKTQFQRFYEALYMFSLVGMGFGGFANLRSTGETNAIKYVLEQLSGKQLVIFDVGANVGLYTIALLKLLRQRNAKIYSFEPSREAFTKLKKNIQGDSRVASYNMGFGEANKQVTLYRDTQKSHLGFASVYKRRLDHYGIYMDLKEQVHMRTVDAFCAEQHIKHIDFLKVDVEGNELNVLKGATEMMNKGNIDFIQFEFGGTDIDARTFFQDFYYLLHEKYKIYRILNNGLYPIHQYKQTQEIFLSSNYLAERITYEQTDDYIRPAKGLLFTTP
jgi:FkbM family methyltransferase